MNRNIHDGGGTTQTANQVSIAWGPDRYDALPPFSPGFSFPEYPFSSFPNSAMPNRVYQTVRESLRLLNLDIAHYGSPDWNPLGEIIAPGQTVVLKPNFVREFRETQPEHGDCLITHGSVIRAVLDYVFIALGGNGRIVVADSPQNDADFNRIRRIAGLDEIQQFYRSAARFEVEVYDLRPERVKKVNGVIVSHSSLPGDPAGYVKVNLGLHSTFTEINHLCHLLYGSEYDVKELHRHQHDDIHEYLVSQTILDADCLVNLPKMKTHKKTGITASMKNLVGINGNKNWLPHHREGTLVQGGDQYADCGLKRQMEQMLVAHFKRLFPLLGPLRQVVAAPVKKIGTLFFGDTNTNTIRSGNWFGNDTTWRMVMDLNRILLYADRGGNIRNFPVRRFVGLVDGIIAGQGNGPLDATPKPAGLILAGSNPVAIDFACARLMGFDYHSIPMLHRAFDAHPLPLVGFRPEDFFAFSNRRDYTGPILDFSGSCLAFVPHFGWKGCIELS